jgi:hypothetical protein
VPGNRVGDGGVFLYRPKRFRPFKKIQPNAIVEEYTVRAREANASLRKTWDSWIENGRPIYAFEEQLLGEIMLLSPVAV